VEPPAAKGKVNGGRPGSWGDRLKQILLRKGGENAGLKEGMICLHIRWNQWQRPGQIKGEGEKETTPEPKKRGFASFCTETGHVSENRVSRRVDQGPSWCPSNQKSKGGPEETR